MRDASPVNRRAKSRALLMTVLIVDDHTQVRQIIRNVIADLAEEIRECASGEEALAACADQPPDWVLLDIELIGLDGLSTARVIVATWPAVRVCMVTNYDDLALRAEASVAGASAYVVKENLLVLREILRATTGGGAAASGTVH
jgi:DNA-binding NarL/FixJ family response regulator